MYETSCQSRFDARYWMLGAGALGQPRGMEWGGTEFKMLGVRNIPQMSENSLAYSTFTWAGLLKHLRQMLISNAKMEEGKGYFKNIP